MYSISLSWNTMFMSPVSWVARRHKQNVNWSGSYTQCSPILRYHPAVVPSTFRRSQSPMEHWNVFSDCASAISGASESTYSCNGALRMLCDLNDRIVKFWSYWALWTGLQVISRAPEITAQICMWLWDTLRLVRMLERRLGAIFSL
jgi:hypothetical protein